MIRVTSMELEMMNHPLSSTFETIYTTVTVERRYIEHHGART